MSLQKLKSTLGMGARANKYRITFGGAPVTLPSGDIIDTLCKGGSIPAKTIGTIEVFSQGRKLMLAGDASFENTWTLTFYNTQDLAIRKAFEDWMTFIDDFENHSRGASNDNNSYMSTGTRVAQLSTNDNSTVTAEYEFHNMFPTNVSAVDLADETNDAVSEFTCDFAYSHWIRIS